MKKRLSVEWCVDGLVDGILDTMKGDMKDAIEHFEKVIHSSLYVLK